MTSPLGRFKDARYRRAFKKAERKQKPLPPMTFVWRPNTSRLMSIYPFFLGGVIFASVVAYIAFDTEPLWGIILVGGVYLCLQAFQIRRLEHSVEVLGTTLSMVGNRPDAAEWESVFIQYDKQSGRMDVRGL
jgi:hypothetical protein